MSGDRIEREIEIDAPIDVVWSVITEPEHITGWFTDTAELEARPGGEGRFSWERPAPKQRHVVNLRVERLEPPHFFSFRWDHPDGADPDATNAPLVEFTLEPRGEGTRLRLVESGIQGLARSDDEKDTYLGDHTRGWDEILPRLRTYAAAQPGNAPR